MKYRVKNNRLSLEFKVDNLSTITEPKLREIAGKCQIGTQRWEVVKTNIYGPGDQVDGEEQRMLKPKPRKMLEDEIRKYLTIALVVPKELWTEEQAVAFLDNNLAEEKDIHREIQIKKQYKILQELPPFEKVKDKVAEASMYGEVTPDQWEYFDETLCKTHHPQKDSDGRRISIIKKKVARLEVVEEIPEEGDVTEEVPEKEKKAS